MEEKQIAKEILFKLLEKNALRFEDFPEAKNYVELAGIAFKEIYKAVEET